MIPLNSLYRKYYDYLVGSERDFKSQINWFDKIFKKYKVKTILDCGCGTGTHSILFAKKGYKVTAFDVKNQVDIARKKAKINKVKINFKTGDIRNFNLGKFDAVISLYSVLMFACKNISDFERAVKCIRKSMNPNGIGFFETCTPMNWKKNGLGISSYIGKQFKISRPVFYEKTKTKNLVNAVYVYVLKTNKLKPEISIGYATNKYFAKSEVITILKKYNLKLLKLYGNFDGKTYKNYNEKGNFISPLFKIYR